MISERNSEDKTSVQARKIITNPTTKIKSITSCATFLIETSFLTHWFSGLMDKCLRCLVVLVVFKWFLMV
jgi:hypothetical protein